MKFAKELESDLVPEWRAKYLDYKTGKKKLKALTRALRNVEKSTPSARPDSSPFPGSSTFRQAPFYTFLNRSGLQDPEYRPTTSESHPTSALLRRNTAAGDGDVEGDALNTHPRSYALPIPGAVAHGERTPLHSGENGHNGGRVKQYGSIIASPPPTSPTWSRKDAPSLKLPGPALDSQGSEMSQSHVQPWSEPRRTASSRSGGSAYQVGESSHHSNLAPRYRSIFQPKRVNSLPADDEFKPAKPAINRTFTLRGSSSFRSPAQGDIALNAYREVDFCQAEFFIYLDKELEKIEDFYKQKENEAIERLKVLREQLHIMRDRRVEELLDASNVRESKRNGNAGTEGNVLSRDSMRRTADETRGLLHNGWRPDQIVSRARIRGTKTAQSMKILGTPSGPKPLDAMQDYVRRKRPQEVPYRTAKHKLKIALAEYYRGLELLKSYALLNRTAFRKINKKFDKTVNARPSGRYMTEKVNKAYFVNSGVLESHIQAVEDLYARYFERGNHKIAVGKLRAKGTRSGDFTGSVFRNGLLLGVGAVFGVQGVVYAADLLHSGNSTLALHTDYLLQIYAGYGLMLLLTLLFCLACRVWQKAKVNYAFIFEFDTRHHLDWRQLSEIPCFFGFCLGLTMWLNFSRFVSDAFYVYWPTVLIGISVLVLFNPFPFLYHHSRFWFIRSNWRMFLAGVFPVEFRDFFLGDMYCSQTYALGNIELFFCLYAQHWRNPPMCNSSHSRLLGFFTTLPGIWRALQCLRRYWDTRNVFPHLVNCGKYMFTILYYMSLSLYRLEKINSMRAMFIFFATINATYCSVWDIVMDWSLMDPYAKHRFLRSTLGFKYTWWYYAAMVIDPIIRFNWIFYAIYANETQHSSLVSFFVAFSEVFRRGMWTLFRVENEHCTNVGRFRASRDIPLPYEIPSSSEDSIANKPESAETNGRTSATMDEEPQARQHEQGLTHPDPTASHASGADIEQAGSPAGESRQRKKTVSAESPMVRAFSRVGTILHSAHAQDFERRRRPELGSKAADNIGEADDDDDDDDGDGSSDSDTDAVGAVLANRRRHQQGIDRHHDEGLERNEARSVNHTVGSPQLQTAGEEDEGDDEVSDGQTMSNGRHGIGSY